MMMEVEESKRPLTIHDQDEFMAFRHPEFCFIEGLYFLSDSTILILLSGQEMRILDTQSFEPQGYDADKLLAKPKKVNRMSVTSAVDGRDLHLEELESGIKCAPVLK